MIPIISQSGFLPQEECGILSEFLVTNVRRLGQENVEPFFSYRQINYASVDNPRVREIMDSARSRIAALVSDGLHGGDTLYPDYTDLVLWKEGQSMNIHQDNLPPHFEHRLYSSVLYLTQCAGGATGFPEYGIEVLPETGRMIAFPSALLHGVSPVKAGTRHILASWYTDDADKREP